MDDRERRSVRESMLKVFSSDDGVIVLRHLAEFAHADDADFCNDPLKDAYLQGRRSVVLEIRNIMKGDQVNE
ncbi:MAG: hypothetical protein IJJ28_02035 [Lentisphaeria bacterium]|nr:hypothetical protein [Lentisphaeria bacterium]